MKRCTTCNKKKELCSFYKRSRSKDGVCSQCKECVRVYKAGYRKANIEKIRASDAKYYQANRERLIERSRKYHQANLKKIKAYKTEYYQINSEKIKTSTAEWQKKNKEKASLSKNKYYQTNKKRVANYKLKYRKANPIKYNARIKVSNAIRDGILTKPEMCCINNDHCGGRVEGHHNDYSKPLDVLWICVEHHRAWHKVFIPEVTK